MIINNSINSGMEYCIFRNAPVYRPRQFLGNNGSGITLKLIESLFMNNLLESYSEGKSKKEFLYIDDLVYYYELAIFKRNGIFNLSTNKSVEIKKVLDLLRKISRRMGNIKCTKGGELYNRSFDNHKLLENFGKIEFTSLKNGLLNTVD